jgi:hypothetical protein
MNNLWQRLNTFDRRLRKIVFTWKGVGISWLSAALILGMMECVLKFA